MDISKDQPCPPVPETSLRFQVDRTAAVPPRPGKAKVFATWKGETSGASMFLASLVISGLAMVAFSRSAVQTVDGEVSRLLSTRDIYNKHVQGFEKDMRVLESELLSFDTIIQQQQGQDMIPIDPLPNGQKNFVYPINEVGALSQKIETLTSSAEHLKSQVQEISRKEAEQKYGPGTHRVEIQLAFPDKNEGPDTMVIELAPIDLMPHSVQFFLDVVSAGLLNGCSFVLNALHVLKSSTLPWDGNSAAENARLFTKHGLESVAFREYNKLYPHIRHTVGLAADGSPSFYINTEDNSEVHLGDPCFGKIIEGFDTVQRLEESPTIHGIWFEKRIGIKNAAILSLHQGQ